MNEPKFKVDDLVKHKGIHKKVLSVAISPLSNTAYYFVSEGVDLSQGGSIATDEELEALE